MDKQQLTETLDKLHAELAQAKELEPETMARLRTLAAELRRLVGSEVAPVAKDIAPIKQRLDETLVDVEVNHPQLTAVLEAIANTLATIGI